MREIMAIALVFINPLSKFVLCRKVKKNCLCYVIIEPGGSTISDVAKKIRAEFNKSNDKFQKLFVGDDYVRPLPTGSSKITSTGTQKSI